MSALKEGERMLSLLAEDGVSTDLNYRTHNGESQPRWTVTCARTSLEGYIGPYEAKHFLHACKVALEECKKREWVRPEEVL